MRSKNENLLASKSRAVIRTLMACGFVVSLPPAVAGLPGTGQGACYDNTSAISCDAGAFPRQDGGPGVITQSYTKLDISGNALDVTATGWTCSRDNVTGLTWEVKTTSGMRDQTHRYAWANAQSSANGGDAGGTTETEMCGNSLNGQACTTENYIAAVNALQLCGVSNWRLPTQRELLTLVHSGVVNPTIDTVYFPNTANDVYWAASTYGRLPSFAWGVHFGYGAANADYKTRPYRVRLVHGAPF